MVEKAEKVEAPKEAPKAAVKAPEVKKEFQEPVQLFEGIPAHVMEISGRAGVFGEVTQVICKILAGRDKNRILRRNIKGPVQKNDIILLIESEREAKALKKKRKGTV